MAPTILMVMSLFLVSCLAFQPMRNEENVNNTGHIVPRAVYKDLNCKCGQKNGARIVGGVNTEKYEYPWQAHLQIYPGGYLCGGSLINDRDILTAAHCTVDASYVIVTLGEHNTASNTETQVLKFTATQITNHPSYNPNTQANDISIIRLPQTISFPYSNNQIAPICLPSGNPAYKNWFTTVTGWGTTSSGGSIPNTLKEVTVKVMSNAKCKASGYSNSEIKPSMICAAASGKDSCQGDSGGPLAVVDKGGNHDLAGIVSWGYGCALSNYPGVYTRVTSFKSWIIANTDGAIYCKPQNLNTK